MDFEEIMRRALAEFDDPANQARCDALMDRAIAFGDKACEINRDSVWVIAMARLTAALGIENIGIAIEYTRIILQLGLAYQAIDAERSHPMAAWLEGINIDV